MAGVLPPDAERVVPDTPARTMRLAMARAAEGALGLKLSVTAVADDAGALDAVAGRFAADLLHLELRRAGRPVGYAVIDGEFRAAVVEMQTTGRLAPRPSTPRAVTSADAALCAPLVTALMTDLRQPDRPGDFGPWVEGLTPGGRIAGPREVRMALDDGNFRILEFGVDLGVEGRTGQLSLVLPDRARPALGLAPPAAVDWGRAFERAVRAAPADLTAVLHRVRLPLRDVAGFAPGTVLPLHGVSVGSLVLEGPGRRVIGYGRLGQVSGLRAVKVGTGRPAPDLSAAPIPAAAPAGAALTALADPAPGIDLGEIGDLPDLPGVGALPDIAADPGMDDLPDIGELPDTGELPDPGGMPDLDAPGDLPDLGTLGDLPPLDIE